MKVVSIKDVQKDKKGVPLFTGEITSQTPIKDEEGSDVSINYIHFPKGVRNKLHMHSNDQVLIVTHGQGIVATKDKKVKVGKGDVIRVPAGEEHWHGAVENSDFTHISVTRSGTKLKQTEK